MSFRYFPDQAVGPQQTNLAGCSRSLPFLFGACGFGRSEQQHTQVMVAEAVDGKFAPVHCVQETVVVGTERLQCPHTAALPFGRLTKVPDSFSQSLLVVYGRQ